MFAATGHANASHTLTIEVTGRQNASATSDAIVVDAFDVPAATVSRLQETDPHIAYTGTALVPDWTAFDMSRAWSGGTATTSKQPGAQATITFTGTGISWIGAFGLQTGIARITLDGAVARDNSDSPSEQIRPQGVAQYGVAHPPRSLTIAVEGIQKPASTS